MHSSLDSPCFRIMSVKTVFICKEDIYLKNNNKENIGFHNNMITLMSSHLLIKYLNEHTDELSTYK